MIPVRTIPSTVDTVDMATGKVIETKPANWNLLPPPADCCQICAKKHTLDMPHNAQSLYYATAFNARVGRSPTWADAMAHCTPEIQAAWRRHLTNINAWSAPPAGQAPVAHYGAG